MLSAAAVTSFDSFHRVQQVYDGPGPFGPPPVPKRLMDPRLAGMDTVRARSLACLLSCVVRAWLLITIAGPCVFGAGGLC